MEKWPLDIKGIGMTCSFGSSCSLKAYQNIKFIKSNLAMVVFLEIKSWLPLFRKRASSTSTLLLTGKNRDKSFGLIGRGANSAPRQQAGHSQTPEELGQRCCSASAMRSQNQSKCPKQEFVSKLRALECASLNATQKHFIIELVKSAHKAVWQRSRTYAPNLVLC